MEEKFTQADSDNLADIIWWIKGYLAAFEDSYQICPFQKAHEESLKRARTILDELILNKKED